jgi:hypothetical protein
MINKAGPIYQGPVAVKNLVKTGRQKIPMEGEMRNKN